MQTSSRLPFMLYFASELGLIIPFADDVLRDGEIVIDAILCGSFHVDKLDDPIGRIGKIQTVRYGECSYGRDG